MGSKPKVHTVYESPEAGLHDILDAAVKDEPMPTPRAAELIQEAKHAGPVVPGGAGGLPTLAGGDGTGELVADAPVPGPTPRQSAENLIELAFALVPAGDWQPESAAERDELTQAVERVFAYRGWILSLPPEAILLAVMGKYTRRRMQKPAVAARLGPWLKKVPLIGKLVKSADVATPAVAGGGGGGAFDGLPKMTPEPEM